MCYSGFRLLNGLAGRRHGRHLGGTTGSYAAHTYTYIHMHAPKMYHEYGVVHAHIRTNTRTNILTHTHTVQYGYDSMFESLSTIPGNAINVSLSELSFPDKLARLAGWTSGRFGKTIQYIPTQMPLSALYRRRASNTYPAVVVMGLATGGAASVATCVQSAWACKER
jgi:hypothetical protein